MGCPRVKYEHGRQVRKRDGRLVLFERGKIADAIFRAAKSVGGEDRFLAEQLAGIVAHRVITTVRSVPTIEDIQDAVEKVLIEAGHAQTAKAYILYRDRRAQARATRCVIDDAEGAAIGATFVGGDDASLRRFSKSEIANEVAGADGLDNRTAEDVARSVEDRILRSPFKRISQQTLVSLVRAELFDRGHLTRYGEAAVLHDARFAARHVLAFGDETRAPRASSIDVDGATATHGFAREPSPLAVRSNPGARLEWLGEHVLGTHVLSRELSPAAMEAHRLGDIHFYDVGSPFRLTALSLDAVTACAPLLSGNEFSRDHAPLRAFHALSSAVLAFAPLTSRGLSLEHVNVFLAPFVDHLDSSVLAESIRAFYLSPALIAPRFGASAGRASSATVELLLSESVPSWLRDVKTPGPAAPGRTFGDFDDVAERVGTMMLRELDALRQRRHPPAVRVAVVATRDSGEVSSSNGSSRESLRNEALRHAARGCELAVAIDEVRMPRRGPLWFRVAEHEVGDPFRFARGDVTIGSLAAVNIRAVVKRVGRAGVDDVLRESKRLMTLALEAAVFRKQVQRASSAQPGGALYGVRRERDPLADIDDAFHVIELVGLDACARVEPGIDPIEAVECVRNALTAALAHEAAARELRAVLIENAHDESRTRFAALELVRFDRAAHATVREPVRAANRSSTDPSSPMYSFASGSSKPVSSKSVPLEQGSPKIERTYTGFESNASPTLGLSSSVARLDTFMPAGRLVGYELRMNAESPPHTTELRAQLERAFGDPSAFAFRVTPWPRRSILRSRSGSYGADGEA